MSDWLRTFTPRPLVWHLAVPERIHQLIIENFGVGSGALDDGDESYVAPEAVQQAEEVVDEDAAVVRFVTDVIKQAVEDQATDIHFEPQEEQLRIRYRVDGLLVPVPVPENLLRFQDAIISLGDGKKGSTRRRRTSRIRGLNAGDAGNFLTQTALPGVAGAIAANYLPKIGIPAQYQNYAALALGLVLNLATNNPMINAAGAGMAIVGGAAVVNDLLDGQNGLGLLPPGVTARGIAGNGNGGMNPVEYAL
jgi:hypothetical protein